MRIEIEDSTSQNRTLSEIDTNNLRYCCYHNGCGFNTDDEMDYRRHGAQKHPKNPLLYPSKAEMEKYGLQAQGKSWEV